MDDASVLSSVRGVPSWGAIGIAVILTVAGAVFDGYVSGTLTWGFKVGFVCGVALAALAVRRGSIFTAMVQAPLIMVVVASIAQRLISGQRVMLVLIDIVNTFPTMAIGTGVGLLLGVVRLFAQPLRSRPAAAGQRLHA